MENFTFFESDKTFYLDCKRYFKIRVTKALENLAALDKVWKSKAISLRMKKTVPGTRDMHI